MAVRHIKSDAVVTAATSIGTSFDKSKAATFDVGNNAALMYSDIYFRLDLSSISGASSITLRITDDADGDSIILPDTAASIATGLTTATSGVVAFYAEVPFFKAPGEDLTWYAHVKTDAGTVTVSSAQFVAKSFR